MSVFKIIYKPVSLLFLAIIVSGCEARLAIVRTIDVINITTNSAQSGGIIMDEGTGFVVARGLVWSASDIPTLESHDGFTSEGIGPGIFKSNITGLSPSTEYMVAAYASNKTGISYGDVFNFTTLAGHVSAPEIITRTPEVDGTESALLGGKIVSDGGRNIIEKGVYWGTYPNPEITGTKIDAGSGSEGYTVTISGLVLNETYYVKAYIINSEGEYLGMQVSFTIRFTLSGNITFNNNLSYGSVSDIEGNIYKTVQIGSQTWMAENLKTTKLNDGTSIPNVSDKTEWVNTVLPSYSWYNNLDENKELSGARYNWYAVSTSKLCPAGWHVPSDNEWAVLTDYLGGLGVAGAKMKETGFTHWMEPNYGATNSSGFTAIPAGQRRGDNGVFNGLGLYDCWWSSTEYNIYKAWYRSLASINTEIWRSSGAVKQTGISIRCIRD